ncbi:hypothetical protein FRX31_029778 [Thalictrum thalictroides]|uniref:Uncharacterized protein n=1 Tax=Thalictrum thalictroides TaxID=46969 RepID=A0A7J6V8X3_THATH|nr:hypothetical protein FRX31_029778 [Thalictrum thalictroides]
MERNCKISWRETAKFLRKKNVPGNKFEYSNNPKLKHRVSDAAILRDCVTWAQQIILTPEYKIEIQV